MTSMSLSQFLKPRAGLFHPQVFKEFKMSEQNKSLLYKVAVLSDYQKLLVLKTKQNQTKKP